MSCTDARVLTIVHPAASLCPQSNTVLTQQLADSNHLLAALREEAAELAGQLSAVHASVAAKDRLIQQLKGLVSTGDGAGGFGSGPTNELNFQHFDGMVCELLKALVA